MVSISPDAPLKQCTKCKEWKPLTEFYRGSSRSDGYYPSCKWCKRYAPKVPRPAPENLPEGFKRCTKCREVKSMADFSYEDKQATRIRPTCKECTNEAQREWKRKNPERALEGQHRRRACYKAAGKKYRNSAESRWKAHLKTRFGLTPEEYEAMLVAQFGLCAICGLPPQEGKRLTIDHCHKSNLIRSLLCNNCNTMLGMAQDNPAILRAGIKYLRLHST